MNFRTDLAAEAAVPHRLHPEDATVEQLQEEDLRITRIRIKSPKGEAQLGKPRGQYITGQMPPLSDDEKKLTAYAGWLGRELTALLPPKGTVLVAGLGSRSVTPDALGPMAAGMVLATRHIQGEFARAAGLENLRPTAVMAPGVLGQTGTESTEILRGVCREIRPAAVIVIDALAARSADRLGCTVQLCDTGISPGSGVGNNRPALNQASVGVPVIGLGVPTVVDAATLVEEIGGMPPDKASPHAAMMVTPREIDLVISRAARLLAMGIHMALQPDYSPLELIEIAREM